MKNLPVRFGELCSDPIMFSGYMHALDVIMPGFIEIADAIQNADDVTKKALSALINEHMEFRYSIDNLRQNQDIEIDEIERLLPPALRP
ncbi:hypothetical protein SAMN04488128_101234 [Chitinophaga eiseniae]|uniref:Uncharacterized protein n=2 Tax=Chitinophaga eiseniae TaxID=634771 RepID=A0A1T4KP66_9BACT|nr:hypothetical protein SAMN04488128_101234 [Chitinophaga eiseniae]